MNNQTAATMMCKIINNTQCSLEVVLRWELTAKNNLPNVAGFSPFKLVLGKKLSSKRDEILISQNKQEEQTLS